MMFDIRILEDSPPTGRGEITLGEFKEGFQVVLEYWNADEYRGQWLGALQLVTSNPGARAALITSLTDPQTANFLFWWPIYREAEELVFQNQVLIFEDLDEPFKLRNYTDFISRYERFNDDGDEISEWRVSVDDVRSFLHSAG